MASAGPDTFMRRPNPVQNLRGWTPARGKDAATKAPHPVRWSHNTRTARRRFRCGGRDRQKRDMAYPGECRRSHIFFHACLRGWGRDGSLILANPTPIAKKEAIFSGGSTAFMPSPLGGRSGDVFVGSDRSTHAAATRL